MKKFLVHAASAFIPGKNRRRKFRKCYKPSHRFDFNLDYGFHCTNENPLIIDCGANVGRSVNFFMSKHPGARIIAFEADKNIFDSELIPNLSIKGEVPKNIECFNKAVWVDDAGISFFPKGNLSGTCVSPGQHEEFNPVRVESVRLKSILQKQSKIDFLKLDIEGAEVDVVKDCADELNRVDRLFIEYHSFRGEKQDLSEILAVLEFYGFRYRIAEDYNPSGQYWNYCDNGNEMDCQLKIFALNPELVKEQNCSHV